MARKNVALICLYDPTIKDHAFIKTAAKAGAILTKAPTRGFTVRFNIDEALNKHLEEMISWSEVERLVREQRSVLVGHYCARCGHGLRSDGCTAVNAASTILVFWLGRLVNCLRKFVAGSNSRGINSRSSTQDGHMPILFHCLNNLITWAKRVFITGLSAYNYREGK